MNITRDVITDLLPVYLAGEASHDTRALIEDFLVQNPALAAEVRAHAAKSAALLDALPASAPPDEEKATFQRIREYTRYRNQYLVFALVFALLPLTFVFNDGHITWVMLRDNPKQAGLFFIASGMCWLARVALSRKMST